MQKSRLGYIYSLLSVLIMSITPILNKLVVGNYSPLVTVFYFSLASTIFTGIGLTKNSSFTVNHRIIEISIINTSGVIAQFFSLSLLSAATFAFIGRFYIIFAVLLASFILKERLRKNDIWAIVISVMGSLFVSGSNPNFNNFIGILLALLYTFLFALASNLTKQQLNHTKQNVINFYNQLTATILTGLLSFITEQSFYIGYLDLGFIMLSALASGVIGMAFYYKGMAVLNMAKVGIVRSLSPVVILFYSVLIFHTKINTQLIVGGLLILVSIVVMNFQPKNKRKG